MNLFIPNNHYESLEKQLLKEYINIILNDFINNNNSCKYFYNENKNTRYRIICNSTYPYVKNENIETTTEENVLNKFQYMQNFHISSNYIKSNKNIEITNSVNEHVEYIKFYLKTKMKPKVKIFYLMKHKNLIQNTYYVAAKTYGFPSPYTTSFRIGPACLSNSNTFKTGRILSSPNPYRRNRRLPSQSLDRNLKTTYTAFELPLVRGPAPGLEPASNDTSTDPLNALPNWDWVKSPLK
ncbi:hypothetical protein BCR32DRAFT_290222 [Anaeromyces robustus]|uniref:Uncharacterized protein n=1 Tax=Anaeromyces robustus TaxID=1754192 RepID=A0A1Y1XK61_9FUNG|nr:hypothetical protein BCR32DRAFT_290222 [Anaeromyces robustus]|eukprot:ORX86102.1 hypothetical protein BCR32DRAFT_290222 [Anaeromyces robustus]